MQATSAPVLDFHTHLAGIGQGGTGCYIEPRKFESLLYKLLRKQLGIYDAHREGRLDEAYLERLRRDAALGREHGTLDGAVVFAHERVYLDSGELAAEGQELHVPNDYLFRCCEQAGGLFLPAMSVHPYRKDALDECHRWIERGAVALKWLPNSQGMDPRDRRCLPIYDLLAAKKVPLIAHTGGEHVVRIRRAELGNPEILRPALDRGVTVIVAHCGTASGIFDQHWLPAFCGLARKYPNCYGDNSAFNTPGRARWNTRILKEDGIAEKLVHGSDYPVPPTPWWMLLRLGYRRCRELSRVWSFLERDVQIKRALGYPETVFTNGSRLLPPGSLERWGVKGLALKCALGAA